MLWQMIFVSWSIEFYDFCFQVPANRYGHGALSAAKLKIIYKVLTLLISGLFSVFYPEEELKWNYIVSFTLILTAVYVAFHKW
jgi:uncharacterized protein (DUF486 family)